MPSSDLHFIPTVLSVDQSLNFRSCSGGIALSQDLGVERVPQAVNPWMCLLQ